MAYPCVYLLRSNSHQSRTARTHGWLKREVGFRIPPKATIFLNLFICLHLTIFFYCIDSCFVILSIACYYIYCAIVQMHQHHKSGCQRSSSPLPPPLPSPSCSYSLVIQGYVHVEALKANSRIGKYSRGCSGCYLHRN